jgi:hypothetical protein
MSSIQYKICGNKPPFLAQVWNCTETTIIQQKGVDFSGTCVVFNGLSPSTWHCVKTIDNIGKVIGFSCCTCAAIIPKVLVSKTLSLYGTVSNISTSSTIVGTRTLNINPVLVASDDYSVKFNIITCDKGNTSNLVRLYCNGTALSPYYLNTNNTCSRTLSLNYGDTLTYDMATTLTNTSTTVGCGCAILQIVSGASSAFQPVVSTTAYCKKTSLTLASTTTTTTTTTAAPSLIYVGFTIPHININSSIEKSYYTTLKTSRPLIEGQSFKLKINSFALVDAHDALFHKSSACVAYYLNTVKQVCGEVVKIVNNSGYAHSPLNAISYITINNCNINNFIFCVNACGNVGNTQTCSSGIIQIQGISEMVGGCFTYNSNSQDYRTFVKAEYKSDPFNLDDPYPSGAIPTPE